MFTREGMGRGYVNERTTFASKGKMGVLNMLCNWYCEPSEFQSTGSECVAIIRASTGRPQYAFSWCPRTQHFGKHLLLVGNSRIKAHRYRNRMYSLSFQAYDNEGIGNAQWKKKGGEGKWVSQPFISKGSIKSSKNKQKTLGGYRSRSAFLFISFTS